MRGGGGRAAGQRPAAALGPPRPHSPTPAAPPRPRSATAAPPAAQDQPGSRGLRGSAGEPQAGARAPEAGTEGGAGRAADPGNLQTAGGAAHARCGGDGRRGGALPGTWRTGWAAQERRPPLEGFYFVSQRPSPAPRRAGQRAWLLRAMVPPTGRERSAPDPAFPGPGGTERGVWGPTAPLKGLILVVKNPRTQDSNHSSLLLLQNSRNENY